MLHVKWVFQYISFLSLFQFVGRKSFIWQNCHSFMRQFLILVGCLAGKVHQLSFFLHSLLSLSIPKKMCTSDLPFTHRFYKDWLLGDCRSWTLSCFILCITPLLSFLNFFSCILGIHCQEDLRSLNLPHERSLVMSLFFI